MRCLVIKADGVYPYLNQAIEASLLDFVKDDTEILYLWQNDKTAFIGKNQNAFVECRVPLIKADGGYIARRISGGGAVYHDKGNINFTFVSTAKGYDTGKNFEIMTGAMRRLGFDARLNGRNDVTIDGRKFSGNAFYRGASCFHHGTVLIGTDTEKMKEYLSVSKAKLAAKGVSSVVSRVVNLKELIPSITPEKVADALITEFGRHYGAKVEFITKDDLDGRSLSENLSKFEDEKWIMGDNVYFDAQTVTRFGWGTADIRLKLKGTVIENAKIYSDSLDCDGVTERESLLVGADLYKGKDGVNDIIEAFKEQLNEF